jgi:nucleotide-binding universal stress UspA family protein
MEDAVEIHKILIAMEDSQYSDKAAAYGFALARKLEAEVGLIHVNEIPAGTPYIADPMINEPPIVLPEMIHIQEENSKNLLSRISNTFGKGVTTYQFQKLGNPKDEILAVAAEWQADMIILGTHGRTGLDHFIAGSVAESITRHTKCPVLIIPNKE